MKSCPWCGKLLSAENLDRCEHCKWTRTAYNMKPALLAYGLFVLVAIVLGIGVFKYVRFLTRDVNVKSLGATVLPAYFEGLGR